MTGKVRHPGDASTGEPKDYLCDVQHCNIHRRVCFLPSLCSSETNELVKVCVSLVGWVDIRTVLINHCNKDPPLSQETPFQSQLHYQFAISSWPSPFLCLVDLTQAGYEAAAKKVFIRKYGSEGNI